MLSSTNRTSSNTQERENKATCTYNNESEVQRFCNSRGDEASGEFDGIPIWFFYPSKTQYNVGEINRAVKTKTNFTFAFFLSILIVLFLLVVQTGITLEDNRLSLVMLIGLLQCQCVQEFRDNECCYQHFSFRARLHFKYIYDPYHRGSTDEYMYILLPFTAVYQKFIE